MRRFLLISTIFGGVVGVGVGVNATNAAAQACRIDAQAAALEDVRVSVGADKFTLKLRNVALTLWPTSATTATVNVRAPLRFKVLGHPTTKVAFRIGRRVSLLGGRLTVGTGIATRLRKMKHASMHAEIKLPGLTLRNPVAVPCTALTVASSAVRTSPGLIDYEGTRQFATSDKYFPLYRTRRKINPVWVKLTTSALVQASKPGWVHIVVDWKGGSRLSGWVPSSDVNVSSAGMLSASGWNGIGVGSFCGGSHRPHLVTFTLRRNAAIAARAGGTGWAKTAHRLKVQAFAIARSDGWVRIARLKQLATKPCGYLSNLWFHTRDIIWTKSKTP